VENTRVLKAVPEKQLSKTTMTCFAEDESNMFVDFLNRNGRRDRAFYAGIER
jgi:hypothetical protein